MLTRGVCGAWDIVACTGPVQGEGWRAARARGSCGGGEQPERKAGSVWWGLYGTAGGVPKVQDLGRSPQFAPHQGTSLLVMNTGKSSTCHCPYKIKQKNQNNQEKDPKRLITFTTTEVKLQWFGIFIACAKILQPEKSRLSGPDSRLALAQKSSLIFYGHFGGGKADL